MENIVIYFSHAGENYFDGAYRTLDQGNASVIAHKLKDILHAPIFEIKTVKDYPTRYKDCCDVALDEKNSGHMPDILADLDLRKYTDIYLVYPCWWGTCPMAVFSFLGTKDLSNTNIHPICTHEGSGMGVSEKDLAKYTNAHILPGLAIRGSNSGNCDKDLLNYVG